MSRSEPVLGLRKPGARKLVSDEEARLLEERLNAAEKADPPEAVVDPPEAVVTVSPSPVTAASPPQAVVPAAAPTTVSKRTSSAAKETEGSPRRETNIRSAASYPRGKGSKADPYRRAKDGKAMRSTTVFLADDMHERLRMHCAQHERSQSEVIAEALELLLPRAR